MDKMGNTLSEQTRLQQTKGQEFEMTLSGDKSKNDLDQVFDIPIFSELLGIDGDGTWEFSRLSLFLFIDTGYNTVDDLDEAMWV